VVVVLVAGCGSSTGAHESQSRYDSKLRRVGEVFSDGLEATFVIPSRPATPAHIASEAHRRRVVLDTAAVELANARPPHNAERDNQRVVAGLRFVSGEIAKYAKAAAARDWSSINRLDQEDSRSATLGAAVDALLDLKKKGYEVGARFSGRDLPFPSRTSNTFCTSDAQTVVAPSVIGQPEPEAVRHLRDAGLDATVFPQIKPNPRGPAGVVVHESPLNFPVCRGTPIWITVSIGKK
jgi:hypothetical protein